MRVDDTLFSAVLFAWPRHVLVCVVRFSSRVLLCSENVVFVGGISREADAWELFRLFEAFGKVEEVKMITDRATNRCKGYG